MTEAEAMYFRSIETVHGYGTCEGWAHNDRTGCWELHGLRGQVRGSVTDESIRPALSGTEGMCREAQRSIVRRFVVPLPVLYEDLDRLHAALDRWAYGEPGLNV